MDKRKKLHIFTLGGTIAMKEDANGQAKPAVEGDELVAQIERYGDIGADMVVEQLTNEPSGHLTPDIMLDIAQKIKTLSDAGETDGFVITQGTDTQEETAYMLDLVLDIPQPVVITGAMRNASEPSYDGIINIRNSCRAAAAENSRNRGVMLYCNDMLHAARDVTKTHTSNVATFQSPFYGPVGMVEKRKVLYFRKPLFTEHYPMPQKAVEVAVIKLVAGMQDYLLRACIDHKVDGIVIEAFGRGHVTPFILPAIEDAVKQGIPVILCSRCYGGFVLDAYSHVTSAARLKSMGVIFGGDLRGQKARLKLIAVLGMTRNMEQIRKAFETPFYDEDIQQV